MVAAAGRAARARRGLPRPKANKSDLFSGDHLGGDVFRRVGKSARRMLQIAPGTNLVAVLLGIRPGLPKGCFGGKLDAVIPFIADLSLAYAVTLLIRPEIRDTGMPVVLAAAVLIFLILILATLYDARFHTSAPKRNLCVGAKLLIGLRATSRYVTNLDPASLRSTKPNLLNDFVYRVFVNAPDVSRIVRGIVRDIKARDCVASGQPRRQSAWDLLLWEILPNTRDPLAVDFCLRIGETTRLCPARLAFSGSASAHNPQTCPPGLGSTIYNGRRSACPRSGSRPCPDVPCPRPEPSGARLAQKRFACLISSVSKYPGGPGAGPRFPPSPNIATPALSNWDPTKPTPKIAKLSITFATRKREIPAVKDFGGTVMASEAMGHARRWGRWPHPIVANPPWPSRGDP